jgi:sterol 14-demethylase
MKRDIHSRLNELLEDPTGTTDPFDSIYSLVFKLTMRTVGCNDVADDPEQLQAIMRHYEVMDKSFTPIVVYFPWLPTIQGLQRKVAGAKIYMALKRIVDNRRKTGVRGDDPLQYLMDQGDNMTQIIGVRLPCEHN